MLFMHFSFMPVKYAIDWVYSSTFNQLHSVISREVVEAMGESCTYFKLVSQFYTKNMVFW